MPIPPSMPGAALAASLDELSDALWRERRILDALLDATAAEEVERRAESGPLVEQLRVAGLLRAVRVDAVARLLDIGPAPTLRRLALATPEPWPVILERHREALRAFLGIAASDLAPRGALLSLVEVLA